jgi:predicted RNase H-like HicB family nuclease
MTGREATPMELEQYLAVPYLIVVESIRKPDGNWVRRAEYPELPGCVVEAESAVEAVERLEEEKVRYIVHRLERGEPVPVPRPPLQSVLPVLNPERVQFARWLVTRGRISDA